MGSDERVPSSKIIQTEEKPTVIPPLQRNKPGAASEAMCVLAAALAPDFSSVFFSFVSFSFGRRLRRRRLLILAQHEAPK